jgi:type II restriction endonuclease EcoO109I-like protein
MKNRSQIVDGVASEIASFVGRRAEKLANEIGAFLNINPFLLAAISEMHEIHDQSSLAEFLLAAHLATGHSTSFGKLIDERILPLIFGTSKLNAAYRRNNGYQDSVFDDIDHIVTFDDGKEFLLSLKAGAWTIQHGQAMQLYENFKTIGERHLQKDGIVVGVFYGNETLLTNKYEIVRGINPRHQATMHPLEFVEVKAGREFWTWLNQGEVSTQDWVMEGIRKGSEQCLVTNADLARTCRDAPMKLREELQRKYRLAPDGSLDWFYLLHAINDVPSGSNQE